MPNYHIIYLDSCKVKYDCKLIHSKSTINRWL